MDPFAVFGIDAVFDLDLDDLESRYLTLSRECHPDFLDGAGDEIEVLQRSADLNRAHRMLRDEWERAQAIVEHRWPGAMERNKQLDPMFLMDAMELAESVAAGDSTDSALRARIESAVASVRDRVRTALAGEDGDVAARALHESRYTRKAATDLEAKTR